METGKLIIIRARYFNDKMSGKGFNIFIDGKDMGKVSYKSPMTYELPVGEHQVYGKINWGKSKLMTVNIMANETKEIELGLTNPPTKKRVIIAAIFGMIWIGGMIIGKAFHIEWLREIGFGSCYAICLYSIFIMRKKSAMYQMLFAHDSYLYLKEMQIH